ncbi:hypothetical protein H8L32_06665 [Undibacterium sp. CY18W]|uniref:Uncharacterized protein n=1 Tax=Undibacterium hunanense TaxID=2762292 RepID=A0ABR6ZMP4_9BURK|nr:hypothetical protein [Undibacterium hunanense]MBC3917151.1 hypothetical protein [Undibacterium hunanense]
MTDFALTLQLTKADTASLNQQGYRVAIVKGAVTKADEALIWVSFAPFEQNFVTWNSSTGLFGSPDPLNINAPITAYSSEFPASLGMNYPFQYNTFGTPEPTAPPGVYGIKNVDGCRIVFGVLQSVTANGSSYHAQPTCVIAAETNTTIQFDVTETLSIFLYEGSSSGSTVIANVSAVLKVDMTSNPQQTIHFDGKQFAAGVLS